MQVKRGPSQGHRKLMVTPCVHIYPKSRYMLLSTISTLSQSFIASHLSPDNHTIACSNQIKVVTRMQVTQASSSNYMTRSTFHSISSLYRGYLQRSFPIFLSFDSDFSVEKLVKCVLCNCGAEYTTVTCKDMVKGFIFPFAKGTPNIKVIFLFEVNFDIKHSCSGFEYDPSQIWLKFLCVLCPTK